jgi:hypothetical protein
MRAIRKVEFEAWRRSAARAASDLLVVFVRRHHENGSRSAGQPRQCHG